MSPSIRRAPLHCMPCTLLSAVLRAGECDIAVVGRSESPPVASALYQLFQGGCDVVGRPDARHLMHLPTDTCGPRDVQLSCSREPIVVLARPHDRWATVYTLLPHSWECGEPGWAGAAAFQPRVGQAQQQNVTSGSGRCWPHAGPGRLCRSPWQWHKSRGCHRS